MNKIKKVINSISKEIKDCIKTIRSDKEIMKDIRTKDKRKFSNENLHTQCDKCDNIIDNIDTIFTIISIIFAIFFITFFFYNLHNKNFLIAFCLSLSIIFISFIISNINKNFESDMKKGLSNAEKQITVNELLDLQDNNDYNIYVLKDNESLSKFKKFYDINRKIDMLIINYTNLKLVLYFCCKNGNIKLVYPGDTINILVSIEKITIEEYIKAIQTS